MASQGVNFDGGEKVLNVAVIGYLDCGKSTTVNAIFGKEFTQAAEEDCSRIACGFKLVALSSPDETPTKPCEILEPIIALNSNTAENSDSIHYHVTSIKLSKLPIQMHHGLSLTIFDFPGLDKYPQYEDELKRDVFDVIIAVLDSSVVAKKSLFQAQQELLKSVKEVAKDTPLLILINKVDKPSDSAVKKRVEKITKSVEKIFGVGSRCDALEDVLEDANSDIRIPEPGIFPVVAALSARETLRYRRIATLTQDEFMQLPKDEIMEIAEDVLGLARANSLSHQELVEEAFRTSRPTGNGYLFAKKLEAAGETTLSDILEYCLGGPNRQAYLYCQKLLKMQGNIEITASGGYALEIEKNVLMQTDVSKVVDGEGNFANFGRMFKTHLDIAKGLFRVNPFEMEALTSCCEELHYFEDNIFGLITERNAKLAAEVSDWLEKSQVDLIRSQLMIINEEASKARADGWGGDGEDDSGDLWKDMSRQVWARNLEELDQSLCHATICEDFTREKTHFSFHIHNLRYSHDVRDCGGDEIRSCSWSSTINLFRNFIIRKRERQLGEKIQREIKKNTASHDEMKVDLKEIKGHLLGLKRTFDDFRCSMTAAAAAAATKNSMEDCPSRAQRKDKQLKATLPQTEAVWVGSRPSGAGTSSRCVVM